MMDALLQLDHSLFLAIHLGLACDLLDFLLPLFRNKLFWAPLYVYLLAAVWYQHRKVFWGFILAVAMLAWYWSNKRREGHGARPSASP